jgi:hypothetical protein
VVPPQRQGVVSGTGTVVGEVVGVD